MDVFLASAVGGYSRGRVQAAIREGLARINGATCSPSRIVHAGDTICWNPPSPLPPPNLQPEDLPLAILYEDEAMLAVNKEAGMVVHPAAGNQTGTLVAALLHRYPALAELGERPGLVHRLDKETSGVILVARTEVALADLAAQFAQRRVEKTYLALTEKVPRQRAGLVEEAIARHPVHRKKMAVCDEGRGREAVTAYRVLGRTAAGLWLIECRPKTGRTHQIRVHLKHLGSPVVGDPLYGKRGGCSRHMLHAWKIAFRHPVTGKRIEVEAPPPLDFRMPSASRPSIVGR
jgi:23S rRNA pseudouridine1911/1915/1917 synthase